MSNHWICPEGHPWTAPAGTSSDSPPLCPVCGRAPRLDVPPATQPSSMPTTVTDLPATPPLPQQPAPLPNVPGYELLEVIGRGGMGVVYKARQPILDRLVAVKRMLAGPDADERELLLFRREAEAMARLGHPHIVQVHEVGEVDGCPFLVMEWIEGGNLEQQLKGQPPTDPVRAAALIESLARTMQYAHDHGIVHRDLKPANVLLAADGTPKVADFGLSRRLDRDGSINPSGAILGTPSYMAPEQAAGRSNRVGPAADVYSLGAILYQLLTGRRPFEGENLFDVIGKVIEESPPTPRTLNPTVPRDLETICLKCLHKDPTRRYATATALADDLRRFQNGEPILARPVGRLERTWLWGRRRPRTAALLITGTVLLLLGVAFGFWYWDAHLRLKVVHYAAFVRSRHGPRGIGRLSEYQAGRRWISFRFLERGGRVERMEVVNGHGALSMDHQVGAILGGTGKRTGSARECIYEFAYNEERELVRETARDRNGRVVWALHYTTPTTGFFADARGFPRPRTGSGAAFVEFTHSEQGYETQMRYFDRSGKPQPDHEQVFGYSHQLDALGQIVEVIVLDAKQRPALHPEGYSSIRMKYDEQGNLVEEAVFFPNGRPAVHRDGYHRLVYQHDEYGNPVTVTAFNAADNPVVTRFGYATLRSSRNATGDLVATAAFGMTGAPVVDESGVWKYRAAYDTQGRVTEMTFHGKDGRPTVSSEGYHRVTRAYDAVGNLTEWSCWDIAGQPAISREGVSATRHSYDAHGNRSETAYLDRDGRPVLHRDGNATIRMEYDEYGNDLRWDYLGLDGKPTLNSDGYASVVDQYDDRGNVIERAYFGRNGEATVNRDGVSRYLFVFDDRGNRVETRHHDRQGRLTRSKEGYAQRVGRYNDRGLPIEEAYFGTDGLPVRHANGNARLAVTYDAQGNRIGEAFLDEEGRPLMGHDGYASWRGSCDACGRLLEKTFLDTEGKPVQSKSGYARSRLKYNDAGWSVEVAYFGLHDEPVMTEEGLWRVTLKRDDRGNVLERAYFDTADRPTEGWAREEMRYDDRGNQIEIAFIDKNGKLVLGDSGHARAVDEYDEVGNRVRRTRFGADGRSLAGVAREEHRYNTRRNVVEVAYFDAEGRPVLSGWGYARVVYRYDERGNQLEQSFYDERGQLRSGWARLVMQYNERGNRTEERYLDAAGRPVAARQGFARAVYSCNDYDTCIDAAYFDAADQPIQTRAVITHLSTGRQGHIKGLKVGDVLLSYAGKTVASHYRLIEERKQELVGSGSRELVVLRDGMRYRFSIDPGLMWVDLEDRVLPRSPEAN